MKKWKPLRTEFYESAVQMGFYGKADSGLTGRKDNVRKFWEEVFIKLVCRPYIENLNLNDKKLRILDLGSGSGEAFELLTHIPASDPANSPHNDFVVKPAEIEKYFGLDISPAMIAQARANYRDYGNVIFEHCDLEDGLPSSIFSEKPFNLYFSGFGSMSHFEPSVFQRLCEHVFKHASSGALFIFDIHGKYSPSWPKYWAETKDMLPYTMAYLLPGDKLHSEKLDWFNLTYWDPGKLKNVLNKAAKNSGSEINFIDLLDRSIFVGRHIDTGLLSTKQMPIRYQVNRLLDHGYRGEVEQLKINLSHLEEYKQVNPKAWERLCDYQRKWNRVIYLLEALMHHEDAKVKDFIENTNIELMSDDLKFITWLYRNADRFPAVDYWASIIGPQVAVVLRNLEMSYTEGVGCGHGLVCAVEIIK